MENIVKALNAIALILIIVGGLNWGLVGLFDFNLVSAIFVFPLLLLVLLPHGEGWRF